jgi:3-dehydroquinate dehydratase-1/3-dehydroquinate dehydratase/shikimate dehydrogenase
MNAGKICVAVGSDDAESLAQDVKPVTSFIDVVEVRLDWMKQPDVDRCCRLLQLPLLFTNRPTWEGGACDDSEGERLKPLLEAVRLQAAYVDFEFRAEQQLRAELLAATAEAKTKLILSWHDFETTPSLVELTDILMQMQASGAGIGKIITTAHEPADVLRVLSLQEKACEMGFPLSTFCMGESGRISRFATLYLGGYMTYVALSEKQATAPGQFSALHFNKLCSQFAHVD